MFENLSPIALYLVIFFGKMIEVSCTTIRFMFIAKGNKPLASFVGLLEIFIWINLAGTVLNDIQSDPLKMVIYCLAFAAGIPFGMFLDQKMAVGLTSIQAVSLASLGEEVAKTLRENNFGVTILDGHSVDGTHREMLFVQLKRRRIGEALSIIRKIDPSAIISSSETKSLGGGFYR